MAYKRMIHSNFFDSSEPAKYTYKEKIFLIGLICYADDFGKFWVNLNKLKANIFVGESRTSITWVKNTLKKFIQDGVLCTYQIDNIRYCHFPNWFVPGWFLKQRIDHPRENVHPDCPTCQTEKIARRKRENSRTNKEKENQFKKNKESSATETPLHINKENNQSFSTIIKQVLKQKKKK